LLYRLGLYRQHLACSFVWGHNGGLPGYDTNAFNSAAGARQVVVMVNADEESSFTTERKALDVSYCG
jgi:D-alanyl-D-alanine carboxypeptidase